MIIRPAHPYEAPALKQVTLAAKQFWGYDSEWMTRWGNLVRITPEYLEQHHAYIADEASVILGWYAIEEHGPVAELGHLWVVPERIGSGIGRALWTHALEQARTLGAKQMELEADTHAEGFYQHMGARRVRMVKTEMERMLPIMVVDL
ncbi:MAG: GNAT family N-acetyltransferase [Herpetosiphonaceae bacterium]|nr:GNAT family N-acetyltransferase [Herpetosiphonaceae bacterium]